MCVWLREIYRHCWCTRQRSAEAPVLALELDDARPLLVQENVRDLIAVSADGFRILGFGFALLQELAQLSYRVGDRPTELRASFTMPMTEELWNKSGPRQFFSASTSAMSPVAGGTTALMEEKHNASDSVVYIESSTVKKSSAPAV